MTKYFEDLYLATIIINTIMGHYDNSDQNISIVNTNIHKDTEAREKTILPYIHNLSYFHTPKRL